ncbi:MAG: hypothetical protein AAB526_01745 [Patescibacteria group bacterium]
MKYFFKKIFFALLFFCFLIMPFLIFTTPIDAQDNSLDPLNNVTNKISSTNDVVVKEVIISFINIALGIAGIIAIVMAIIGTFLAITSSGRESETTEARKLLIIASVGFLIVLMSYAIEYWIIKFI